MNESLKVVRESDISSAAVLSFSALWRAKRAADRLPRRDDFSMRDLLPYLGSVLIMDVINGGEDFFYRLIGTSIAIASDRDVTGHFVSQLDFEIGADAVLAVYREMLSHQDGSFWAGQVTWAKNKDWKPFEAFAGPMIKDGPDVAQLIAYFDFPPVRHVD